MPSPDAVLSEMAELGLRGTELGAVGFFRDDPAGISAQLERYGLELVGGFVPLVLHEADLGGTIPQARQAADLIAQAGGRMFVIGVVQDAEWSPPAELDDRGWGLLAQHPSEIERLVAEHGLTVALHPHAGTLIETDGQVERAMEVADFRAGGARWWTPRATACSCRWAGATRASPRSWTPCKLTGTTVGSCSNKTPPSPGMSRRWQADRCATLARASPSFTTRLGRRRRSIDETTASQYRHRRRRGCCGPAVGGVRQQQLEELSHELQRAADPSIREVAKELAAEAAAAEGQPPT
jgi:hypothetical protein